MSKWQQKKLGDIADIKISGVDKIVKKTESQVKLCNYMDVYTNNFINSAEELSVGSVTQKELDTFQLRRGQVLITKDSETPDDIARSAYVEEDFKNVVCGYHIAVITPGYMLDGLFAKYLFDVPSYQDYFSKLANGVTRFGLTLTAIQNAELDVPPIYEQKEIAKSIRDYDDALTRVCEQLCSCEELKKGLMQQIFSGKLRFKDNSGKDFPEWERKKLGEVFDIKNGYTPSKKESKFWKGGTLPWFRMEDIRQNGRILSDSIQHITPEAVKKGGLFSANSIIMSTTATIGEYALLTADSLANQRFTFLVRKVNCRGDIDMKYFYHYCAILSDLCKQNINSGGLLAVNMHWFSNHPIPLPTFPEQQKIAAFLSNLDDQINALKAIRNETAKQKKWLLNNLVTGKIRLPQFREKGESNE